MNENILCYVNNENGCFKAKITLFPSGIFVYSETNHDILGELCQNNKGTWHKKNDTIYLTTFFQNKIDDYIVELGETEYTDSILVYIYSLQTEKSTNDFAFFNENDSLILPMTGGYLCVPCAERENLTQQMLLWMFDNNGVSVSLECGRIYKCFIKDCFPIVMHEEKFVETDSSIIDVRTGDLYLQERTIEQVHAPIPAKKKSKKINK